MGDLTPVLSRSEPPQPLAPLLPEAPDVDLDDLGKGSPGGVSVASHASHGSTDSAGGLADSLQQTRLTCLHGEGPHASPGVGWVVGWVGEPRLAALASLFCC